MKLADLKKMSDDLGLTPTPTKNKRLEEISLPSFHKFVSLV